MCRGRRVIKGVGEEEGDQGGAGDIGWGDHDHGVWRQEGDQGCREEKGVRGGGERNDGWRCRRRGGFNGKRKRGSQIGKSSGRGITVIM